MGLCTNTVSADVTTMIPHHLQVQHAENAWDEYWNPQKKICDLRSKFSFIMIAMSHRIAAATNHLDVEPGPTDVSFLAPAWDKYFEYMSKTIQELNQNINSGYNIRRVLHGIIDLLSVEVSLRTALGKDVRAWFLKADWP